MTRLFQILSTIFNNILFFIHCFCTAFEGVFHMFRSTNKTSKKNKKMYLRQNWRRKCGVRFYDFSLEITLNCHARKQKSCVNLPSVFHNYGVFYAALTAFFTYLGLQTIPLSKTKKLAYTKLENEMWC